MTRTFTIFAAAAMAGAAAIAVPATASAQTLGVGASAGTDGVGADVMVRVTPLFVARGGFRYADLSIDREFDGIDYDADIGFTSGVVALDVHPFANGFRLSTGLYAGGRDIDLNAAPAAPVEIGDLVFTPEQVGVLNGRSEWNTAAPFVGVGFNNGAHGLKRFGFQAMLGVAYIGEPDVSLEAQGGLLADDPVFLAQLAEEEAELADDLDDLQFYPILNLGLTVRF